MGQKPDAKVTPQIARELCQRTASAAVLAGSMAPIGTRYLLTLKAGNWVSGESLASTGERQEPCAQCSGKGSLGNSEQAGRVAGHCTEFDTPFEQASTPSLEALKALSSGRRVAGASAPVAIPFLSAQSNSTRILHSPPPSRDAV
jgi:hypothetical protein